MRVAPCVTEHDSRNVGQAAGEDLDGQSEVKARLRVGR